MKVLIVLSAIVALTLAGEASYGTLLPIAYARLEAGAPTGLDGRVIDTPEVAYAKAEHAAAHINERINLANEAVKSADTVIAYGAPVIAKTAPVLAGATYVDTTPILHKIEAGAPIGPDGRVVDTPEVAYAKAEHAAAHINERIGHNQEVLKTALHDAPLIYSAYATPYVQSYFL